MKAGTIVFCVFFVSAGITQAKRHQATLDESATNPNAQHEQPGKGVNLRKETVAVQKKTNYQEPRPQTHQSYQHQPLPPLPKPVTHTPQHYQQPTSVLPQHYQQPPPQLYPRKAVYEHKQQYQQPYHQSYHHQQYRQPVYQQPHQTYYRQPVYQPHQHHHQQPSSSFFDQFFPFRPFAQEANSLLDKFDNNNQKAQAQPKSPPAYGRKREYTIRNRNNPNEYMTVKEVQVNVDSQLKSPLEAETAMKSIISSLGGMGKGFSGSDDYGIEGRSHDFGGHNGGFPF